MTFRIPFPGELQHCPCCHQRWPVGEEHELRSFGWLHPLPRGITASNTDWMGWLHDGAQGRNRFLVLEAKSEGEPPTSTGQMRFLSGLAALPGFEVRIVRGTVEHVTVFRVRPEGVQEEPAFAGTAASYRKRISDFLEGKPMR